MSSSGQCSCLVDFQTLAPVKQFQFRISSSLFSKNSSNGYHAKKIHMQDASTLVFLRNHNSMLDFANMCDFSGSLYLCPTCQPTSGVSTADADDGSLSSSKAQTGKGFHAFTRYLLSNDACGLCRVDVGEGKGSFAREIFASANGARSRLKYDGILVPAGLHYITLYLFSPETNIRDTLWKSIKAPLSDSATTQQDTSTMKSKGKRAIQLVRQESQQNILTSSSSSTTLAANQQRPLQRILPVGRSFLQGVSEHSNIHARDLTLLHQSEDSNHPYGLDNAPLFSTDSVLLPQDNNSRLDYSVSDFYQDSHMGRQTNAPTAAAVTESARPSFAHVFGKPSPLTIVEESSRCTPNVSRKSSEKSDPEQSNMAPPAATAPLITRKSPSVHMLNRSSHQQQNVSSSSSILLSDAYAAAQQSSTPLLHGQSTGSLLGLTPANSNLTKSPFAHLLDTSSRSKLVINNRPVVENHVLCEEEGDNDNDADMRTESTMDDDEMRRMALGQEIGSDMTMVNQDSTSQFPGDISAIPDISGSSFLLNQSSEFSLHSQSQPEHHFARAEGPAAVNDSHTFDKNQESQINIPLFASVEKKFKGLHVLVQHILYRSIEQQELTVVQGVEQLVQWFSEQKPSNASSTAAVKKTKKALDKSTKGNKKLDTSTNSAATSSSSTSTSSTSKQWESVQKLLALTSIVHKGKLGSDGLHISKVCRVCLIEIYLVFSVGSSLLSADLSAFSKSEKAACRKLFSATIAQALSRLNLAVGSPSISQTEIQSAFEGIFPKNVLLVLQKYTGIDISTMLSPPSLSSHTIMQVLVDDLRRRYSIDQKKYVDMWKLVGQEVSNYDAAMLKSLSPTPQKTNTSSIIMEPLHHQPSTATTASTSAASNNTNAHSVQQSILELAEETYAGGGQEREREANTTTTASSTSAVPRIFSMSAMMLANNQNATSSSTSMSAPAPSATASNSISTSSSTTFSSNPSASTATSATNAAIATTGSTLTRTNTLISNKQHMGYHSNRRSKTVIVPVSLNAASNISMNILNASSASASSSSSSSATGAGLGARSISSSNIITASNGNTAVSGTAGSGTATGPPIRPPLTRSHSTVQQLQYSFQTATNLPSSISNSATSGSNHQNQGNGSGVTASSLFSAVVNGTAAAPASSSTAHTASNGIALRGLAAKVRGLVPQAPAVQVAQAPVAPQPPSKAIANPTIMDHLPTTSSTNRSSAVVEVLPTHPPTRVMKRTRSLESYQQQDHEQQQQQPPPPPKHILSSPSPKRRRRSATTTATLDSLHDMSQTLMTPVLTTSSNTTVTTAAKNSSSAGREPNHGHILDFDESYQSPIIPPPKGLGIYGLDDAHRTPEQQHHQNQVHAPHQYHHNEHNQSFHHHSQSQAQQQTHQRSTRRASKATATGSNSSNKLHSPVTSLRSSLY